MKVRYGLMLFSPCSSVAFRQQVMFMVIVGQLAVCVLSLSPSTNYLTNHSTPGYRRQRCPRSLAAQSSSSNHVNSHLNGDKYADKNVRYVEGLIENLGTILEKYLITGSAKSKESAYNVLHIIEKEAQDPELVERAVRMARRAGLPAELEQSTTQSKSASTETKELGKTDHLQRKTEAEIRKQWEANRDATSDKGSASLKTAGSGNLGANELKNFASDKKSLQNDMNNIRNKDGVAPTSFDNERKEDARSKVAELIARAGAASSFRGDILGIGGLDDVLAQLKRRVWTPLAVPPRLLAELGIQPVRGVLLYGRPGCGKTLLARKLGQILSPARPITVVSGPEVMDRFVGSSEKNLRAVFDSPPDIFDRYRIGESDGGEAFAANAIHVIVMDEFDAIARARGGKDGAGNQGDAGVARDSVVNQLLAKMDGVEAPIVPTLVIALTNKRSLIDPALLRPGRFEVQIEVPPPRTMEQRVSILQIHTRHMFHSGRLLVSDAPKGSAASMLANNNSGNDNSNVVSYDEFLNSVAMESDGFSGASLAGVARAAASHALERSVEDFISMQKGTSSESVLSLLESCVVHRSDFSHAIRDVLGSSGSTDWEEL